MISSHRSNMARNSRSVMMYNTQEKRSNRDLQNIEFSHEDYKQDTIDEADPQLIVEGENNGENSIYKELNRNTKGNKFANRNNSMAFV